MQSRSSNAHTVARLLRGFPRAAQASKLDQDPSGSAHEVVGRLLELIESLGSGAHHRRVECFGESRNFFADTITHARIETTGAMVARHTVLIAGFPSVNLGYFRSITRKKCGARRHRPPG